MSTAEQRAALRESIPVEAMIDPEIAEKAGIPVEKTEAKTDVKEEPDAEPEETAAEVEGEEEEVAVEEKPEKKGISQETFDRRIAKEVEKTRKEREAREALEARLAALEKKESKVELTPAEIKEQAKLEAEIEVKRQFAEQQYFHATNNLIAEAEKEIPNFNARYDEFKNNVDALPREAIDALLNLENGHTVLNHLMDNPDTAAKIMGMSEKKQTIELAKLSDKLAAPKIKALSKTPAPINPLGGTAKSSATSIASDNDSDAAFYAKRQAALMKRVYR